MTFLEFASGPAAWFSWTVFALGAAWRLGFLFLMKKRVDMSQPRQDNARFRGLWMIASRSINHGPLTDRIKLPIANAYLMHMVLAVVIFLASGHIELIQERFGIGWPALPEIAIRAATFVLLFTIAVTVFRRLSHPVLRLLSNFDDWFSLTVTALPVLSGLYLAMADEPGDTLLAVHIMTFNLLLVWFPFGKLMHAFLIFGSRYSTGVAFSHKGLRV